MERDGDNLYRTSKYLKQVLIICLILTTVLPAIATAEESPTQIVFDLTSGQTTVNGEVASLDVPAMVISGRLYVPVRFLSTELGFEVKWDPSTKNINLLTKKAEMTLNQRSNLATINGESVAFDTIAVIVQDKLLLSARTMADYMDVKINYDPLLKTVTIEKGEVIAVAPKPENASPIAQFTTNKTEYRIGEPIRYTDLSYDPDGNGYFLSWEGKQDAFFIPGDYVVTLKVKDTFGQASLPFSRTIRVINDVLTTREEFGFYFNDIDKNDRVVAIDMNRHWSYPLIDKVETRDASRKLIVSNSPETFTQYGILYEEKVKGKYRLYGTHINGMKSMAQFYVMATNSTNEPVMIRKTQKAEVSPTSFPNVLGSQGLVDWFLRGSIDEILVVQPGDTVVYHQSAPIYPTQGTHFIQDIEVTGEAQLTFLVIEPSQDVMKFAELPRLERQDHVRGTYDVSDIRLEIDGTKLKGQPARIVIGDPLYDAWVTGFDGMTGVPEQNRGNYGVFYDIVIKQPGKVAIALVPRGGMFKGAMLFNNEIVLTPKSGMIEPKTAYLIKRTIGDEQEIRLKVSPPSGSSLPFDILIYPLDNRK
jgi:PKD repeat protein